VLIQDFYKYKIEKAAKGEIMAEVYLNKDHEIYQGHFPGHPIVPGVCQMLIIKEILSEYEKKSLRLIRARSVKFLSVIDPGKDSVIKVRISYSNESSEYKVNAEIFDNEVTFFKLKGIYG